MTTAHKITAAVAGAAIVLGGVFARQWDLEREARAKAQTTATAVEKTIAADNTAIADRDKASEATDQKFAQQSAAVTSLAAALQVMQQHQPAVQVVTVPAEASRASMPATPASPAPIETVQRTDLPAAIQAKLPDAPSYAVLTQDQTIQCAKNELAGDQAANDLKTCKADLADRTSQLAAKTTESNAWQTAAKGGTKWHRFLGVLKIVGCSAGGAAVGSIAYKSSPGIGAAAGAAAGGVGCSLF